MKPLTILSLLLSLTQSPGVRVSGRVKGFPFDGPAGLIRVMISPASPARGAIRETTVKSDGAFEFTGVAQGTYDVRLQYPVTATVRVDVKDSNIDSLVLDAGIVLPGKVVVDDGSPLPQRRDWPVAVRIDALDANTSARAG